MNEFIGSSGAGDQLSLYAEEQCISSFNQQQADGMGMRANLVRDQLAAASPSETGEHEHLAVRIGSDLR